MKFVCYIFRLLPHIKGNIGFVFTKEDLNEVREIIRSNKVAAPAKAGALAPIDVKIAPINTGLGPEKTSFFQALAIPTKITRGTIEILVRKKLFSILGHFSKGDVCCEYSHSDFIVIFRVTFT